LALKFAKRSLIKIRKPSDAFQAVGQKYHGRYLSAGASAFKQRRRDADSLVAIVALSPKRVIFSHIVATKRQVVWQVSFG
jgi:hypothetical protein